MGIIAYSLEHLQSAEKDVEMESILLELSLVMMVTISVAMDVVLFVN